jgi:hypothetical protein
VKEAGIFTLRCWCYWSSASRPELTVNIDGIPAKGAIGRNDAAAGTWHWASLEGSLDLGPGEHSLTISGWQAGVLSSSFELRPIW